jgi:hypothetical protein
MHEHHDCEHVLKFCRKCDEAYCTACRAVWRKPCTQNHFPYAFYSERRTWPSNWPTLYGNASGTLTAKGIKDQMVLCNHAG